MPVVVRVAGFTIFFFSNEGNPREPVHVHIRRGGGLAKFWVNPVRLAENRGFAARTLNEIEALVEVHETRILEVWREHFSNGGQNRR